MTIRNSNAYRFVAPGTITYFDTLAEAEVYAAKLNKPRYRIEEWAPSEWLICQMKPGNWAAHATLATIPAVSI